MHAERIGASTTSTAPLDQSDAITVTRGWGDRRTVQISVAEIRTPIMTTRQGGRRRRLPRAMLAVWMSCELIPEGAAFGHDCAHGEGPHSILVLLRRDENSAAIYRRRRAEAEHNSTPEARAAAKRERRRRQRNRRYQLREARRQARGVLAAGNGAESDARAVAALAAV
jgi:hypothetical protein